MCLLPLSSTLTLHLRFAIVVSQEPPFSFQRCFPKASQGLREDKLSWPFHLRSPKIIQAMTSLHQNILGQTLPWDRPADFPRLFFIPCPSICVAEMHIYFPDCPAERKKSIISSQFHNCKACLLIEFYSPWTSNCFPIYLLEIINRLITQLYSMVALLAPKTIWPIHWIFCLEELD